MSRFAMTFTRLVIGGSELLGRRDHLVEHAVDAVPHLELVLERLEVDVRGAILDGLQQHEVQQLDDLVVVSRHLHHRVKVDRLVAAWFSRDLNLSSLASEVTTSTTDS
jgi:hypothetical protein